MKLSIDDATAGMVLAEALRDQAGSVLLAAGATLTGATLNALRRRAIAVLDVAGEIVADDGAGAAERERQCARLARLFRNSTELGATGALLERLYRYRRSV